MKKIFILLPVIALVVLIPGCVNKTTAEAIKSCKSVEDSYDRFVCYTGFAIEENESSICSEIKDFRTDLCHQKIATTNQDYSACEQITKESVKIYCYITIAGMRQDDSICETLQGVYRAGCYTTVRIAKQDPAICQTIVDNENQSLCYYEIAVARSDWHLCDRIQDTFSNTHKNGCYFIIAMATQDPLACERIQDNNCLKQLKVLGIPIDPH